MAVLQGTLESGAPMSRLHERQSYDPADFPVPTGREEKLCYRCPASDMLMATLTPTEAILLRAAGRNSMCRTTVLSLHIRMICRPRFAQSTRSSAVPIRQGAAHARDRLAETHPA